MPQKNQHAPPKKSVPPKTKPHKKRANQSGYNKRVVGGEKRVVREK
jgi:hypothetical protein